MLKLISEFLLVLSLFGRVFSEPWTQVLQSTDSPHPRRSPSRPLVPRSLPNLNTRSGGNSTDNICSTERRDWEYLNGNTWWKVEPTQQDHARLHAYLSMAAYGDYERLCPATFTRGFTVLEKFESDKAQGGFVAIIPEMEKVVIVFRGTDDLQQLDLTPVPIDDLVQDCAQCTVAKGVKELYLSAREKTNDWAIARAAVARTKLRFSVTGHSIGGAVAALASMHLGSLDLVHYSHTQGMPRTLNCQSVIKYNNLFQVLAGQSLVAENDYMVQAVPLGYYTHIGTRIKILGPIQQYLVNCYGNHENSTCNGNGGNGEIHNQYFTPKGYCGSANKGW